MEGSKPWWQGWHSPKSAENWWQTPQESWILIGYHKADDEGCMGSNRQEFWSRPTGHLEISRGEDPKWELHQHAVLKPCGGSATKKGQPSFNPVHRPSKGPSSALVATPKLAAPVAAPDDFAAPHELKGLHESLIGPGFPKASQSQPDTSQGQKGPLPIESGEQPKRCKVGNGSPACRAADTTADRALDGWALVG